MTIYLDNNATSLIAPEVASYLHDLLAARYANPSSQHAQGRRARNLIEDAKESILRLTGANTVGMRSDSMLVTSGGTEANNLAVFGLAEKLPGAIVVSSIEHPSVLAAAQLLELRGRDVRYLPADANGVVQLEPLNALLQTPQNQQPQVAFVSLMAANNETGVLQPIEQAAALCHSRGVPIHSDAVQSFGKVPLRFSELRVSMMTITAHKLHGPVGVGGLIHQSTIAPHPQLVGGFQQLAVRPGTEPAALTAAFAKAAEIAVASLEQRAEKMTALRDRLEYEILHRFPDAVAIGSQVARLPHTLSISFPGLDRQAIQLGLDQQGVACSTGSACASGSSQPSHVLVAMGLSEEIVRGAIRFSLSHETTSDEIDAAVIAVQQVIDRLRSKRR